MFIVSLRTWEISILLLLLGIFISEYQTSLISAAKSYMIHFFQEQWKYRARLLEYSFISLMKHGFAYKTFCRIGND